MAWALLVIVGATLVASGVQSIAGMGFGLVAAPVFIALFGPAEGVLWGNIIGSVTAGTLLIEKRKYVDWVIAIRFFVAAVPVIFATVLLTRNLDASLMDIVVGLIMPALVAFTVFARNMPRMQGRLPNVFHRRNGWILVRIGGAGGAGPYGLCAGGAVVATQFRCDIAGVFLGNERGEYSFETGSWVRPARRAPGGCDPRCRSCWDGGWYRRGAQSLVAHY